MSGKLVRHQAGSEPAANMFAGVCGLIISIYAGCFTVLWRAHWLTPAIHWLQVPFALWQLRHLPMIWKPFALSFSAAAAICMVIFADMMFRRQKLHGDARWAMTSEARRGNLLGASGIILGRRGRQFLRFGGTEHVLLEAPTRTGKGVGVVIPNLLTWEGSVVVLDVKQENWALTAGFRAKNLGQRVLMFNPLDAQGRTARYNPFSHINRHDPVEVINELQKIGSMLFPPPQSGDSFWAESARTAFLGVTAYVAATGADGEHALPFTFGEVYRQFADGDAKRRFPRIINEREAAGRPLSGGCISALRDWVSSSDNTFTSIRQSVTAKINLWLNPHVDAATATSDFDLRAFRDKPISLYLGVSPDDLERAAPIYNLLFQQLIDLNVRELPAAGRHPVKLLLLLDEFPRLGRASMIAAGFSYVAGYGIRLLPVIQSRSQLEHVYGREVTAEIAANCGVELVFRPKTNAEAKEISERLGTYTFRARSRSLPSWGGSGGSVSDSDQRRPLLLPKEVTEFPERDLIVLRSGIPPVRGTKIRFFADKRMARLSRIPAPDMPQVRLDPAIAQRSLKVIAAAGGDVAPATAENCRALPHQYDYFDAAAVNKAKLARDGTQVQTLFYSLCSIAVAAEH
jgi:type IV secretion system protein VirD4